MYKLNNYFFKCRYNNKVYIFIKLLMFKYKIILNKIYEYDNIYKMYRVFVKLICRMDFWLYMFVYVYVKCIGCIGTLKNIK